MDATHYWPFGREYLIWNAPVTALQFWTAGLKPYILRDAIELVYTAFFYSNSAQHLQNLPEEILCGHIVTTLNDTFEGELTQVDESHESGSKSLTIPTPLRRAPQIYQIFTSKNLSFDLPHHSSQLNNTQTTHPKDSEATVLYATVWCLSALMKRAL